MISALELCFEYTVSLKMLSWLRWGGFFVCLFIYLFFKDIH